jgi:hypothetical protein
LRTLVDSYQRSQKEAEIMIAPCSKNFSLVQLRTNPADVVAAASGRVPLTVHNTDAGALNFRPRSVELGGDNPPISAAFHAEPVPVRVVSGFSVLLRASDLQAVEAEAAASWIPRLAAEKAPVSVALQGQPAACMVAAYLLLTAGAKEVHVSCDDGHQIVFSGGKHTLVRP